MGVSGAGLCTHLLAIYNFLKDWQTLIAGVLALAAARMAAKPVWEQLKGMRVQSDQISREFLDMKGRALAAYRTTLMADLTAFTDPTERRLYEVEEFGQPINAEWAFERAASAAALLREVNAELPKRRDPEAISSALAGVLIALREFERTLDQIHLPYSRQQHDEDGDYTDEEWAKIEKDAEEAEGMLGPLASALSSAIKALSAAFESELTIIRDNLKRIDDRLMRNIG